MVNNFEKENINFDSNVQENSEVINKENQERLRKADELMSPEDCLYFEHILGNNEGSIENLYDFNEKALHTTNDFYFEKILESGNINTKKGQEGIYGSGGASFTDGNFELADTFQTVFDDQNTRSADKKFNTEKYNDKVREFIQFFWDKDEEEIKTYLSKISGGKEVDLFEGAVKIAESFKFQAKPKEIADDEERLSKLYGVTIVFDKEKLPELTPEGTEGLQSDFELRSHREGGIPISEASTIFVPESQIANISRLLDENKLSHIEIRPSEELEVIRMVRLLDKG